MTKDSRGAQTVDRAVYLLRHLGSAGLAGVRLVDLQSATRLSRPTVHRLLASLGQHGMVEQDPETRRYRLGREVAILGWLVARHTYDLREFCRSAMEELAEETGDTIFLAVPSGNETICVDRKLGSYPIKALTVDIGTRRPLGVGANGIALLACLPTTAEEEVYDSIRGRIGQFPNVSERVIRAAVREARSSGYAVSDGHILTAVRGVGVPLFALGGVAAGALGIAAIRERIPSPRIAKLAKALEGKRTQVERRLAEFERISLSKIGDRKLPAR